MAEAPEVVQNLSDVLKASLNMSLPYVGGTFSLVISTTNVQIAERLINLVQSAGDNVPVLAAGFVSLGVLYTTYQLLSPLMNRAVIRGVGGERNDQVVEEIGAGSLHVLLCCKTDERFLEVIDDVDSGRMAKRLETEFEEIGLKVDGLRVDIENMQEVIERKKIIIRMSCKAKPGLETTNADPIEETESVDLNVKVKIWSMSTVPSYIDFEAEESPRWRKKGQAVVSVPDMIKTIVEYQHHWSMKNSSDGVDMSILEKAKRDSFIEFFSHVSTEKGEREAVNLQAAYEFLLNEVKAEDVDKREESHGLLEIHMLKETHKLIMEDLELPNNVTRPGEFSKERRGASFNGEDFSYPEPENMEEAVQMLVDRYNALLKKHVKKQQDPETCVYNMFKICSWLLFELLYLHPFSDGNGRLCRILCSYALSSMTPFPSPVYNVWSESVRNDYVQALIDARKSPNRHPTSLLTMIIECNYTGWKNFFEKFSENCNV